MLIIILLGLSVILRPPSPLALGKEFFIEAVFLYVVIALPVLAYVFVITKPGTSEEVVSKVKGVQGVVRADSIYGRFDAVILIEAPDLDSIGKIVYEVIAKDPNIVHTETSIVL